MEATQMEAEANDLSLIEKDCWQRLLAGASSATDAMHNAVVANAGLAGVNMRTLVLRNALSAAKQLGFYTDIRSGKWADLLRQNKISWLFYDAKERIQIRASGTAILHQSDELAESAWGQTKLANRKNYISEAAPSTEIANPVSGLLQRNFTMEESEAGRKNFGVVIATINWMEWLWLSENGHCRASFKYREGGNFTAKWLVP